MRSRAHSLLRDALFAVIAGLVLAGPTLAREAARRLESPAVGSRPPVTRAADPIAAAHDQLVSAGESRGGGGR